jgi:hypothetical protein
VEVAELYFNEAEGELGRLFEVKPQSAFAPAQLRGPLPRERKD